MSRLPRMLWNVVTLALLIAGLAVCGHGRVYGSHHEWVLFRSPTGIGWVSWDASDISLITLREMASTELYVRGGPPQIQLVDATLQRQDWVVLSVTNGQAAAAGHDDSVKGLWHIMKEFPFRQTRAPNWAVAIALLVIPAIRAAAGAFRLGRRAQRGARGNCITCGYDLRGSAGRCPECGAVLQGPTS